VWLVPLIVSVLCLILLFDGAAGRLSSIPSMLSHMLLTLVKFRVFWQVFGEKSVVCCRLAKLFNGVRFLVNNHSVQPASCLSC
jgi:hypothetical protein